MLFDFIKSRYGGKKAFLKFYIHKNMDLFLGRYNNFRKVKNKTERVVFVCKGNICRSAWAECYFKSLSSFPVCSIGLDTTTGSSAASKVIAYAEQKGLDLTSHRTTSVADFQPMPNDLYICMEPIHIKRLRSVINLKKDDIALLGMWYTNIIPYIHDPYSCNKEFTDKCLNVISVAVDNLLLELPQKKEE